MSSSRDEDNINVRSAKALLIVADAIANGSEKQEKVDLIQEMAELNDMQAESVWTTMNTLVHDLRYFASTAISSRWMAGEGGFRDVLNGAYAMNCEPIEGRVKERVRGNFKCTLCGQMEKSCSFVVHFAGRPPVERGQELPDYSCTEFETYDPEKLTRAYQRYAECYNAASTVLCEESEEQWPASAYLGLVAPGETCLKHIHTAFQAKDLIRATIDDAVSISESYADKPPPMRRLARSRVDDLASRIAQLREAAAGRLGAMFDNSDHDFWFDLMERFGNGTETVDDGFERLRAGYVRMQENVLKTGYSTESPSPKKSKGKKKRDPIPCSSDEEEDDVEDDEEDEDYEEEEMQPQQRERKRRAVVVHDDDEDEDGEDEDQPGAAGPSSDRWGSTAASKAGPFAKRRRVSEEPDAPIQARASRRRTEPCDVVVDTETDDISVALRSVERTTASKMRTQPGKIGSRRSTIKKLSVVSMKLLEDGDLALASAVLQGLSKLTKTLETHERGSGLSDYAKSTTFKEVVDVCLRPSRDSLLLQGHREMAIGIAEAIIVAYELLA